MWAKLRWHFRCVNELVDDSHFMVSIVECPKCGQRWVRIMTELVDWGEGNDSQARVLAPLTPEEAKQLAGFGSQITEQLLTEVVSDRKHLVSSSPRSGGRGVGWIEGPLTILPHD